MQWPPPVTKALAVHTVFTVLPCACDVLERKFTSFHFVYIKPKICVFIFH